MCDCLASLVWFCMIVMPVLQPTFGIVCGNYWVLRLHYHWPTIHRWMGRPNVLIGQWNKLSAVLWLSVGSLRNDGANSLAQLNWLSTQLFRILQVFHPVNWFLARSCVYPSMLWWVQLAMCQLHRILLSNSVSWLLLFVHLCSGHRNVRRCLLIVVDVRRSLLWVIGFCWMLPTLASLGSASLGNGLWVRSLLQLALVR